MPIRSMVGPKEPAVEIGDASWYTAILVFSSIVVWVGLRSTQGKIPIAGCIATVILSMLIIETNAAPIVSPLTIAAVAILVYGGYIKPRFFPQRLVTGEPADARETSAQSVLKSKSTPRSP
ncbi:MAG: hypothetical protein H6822_10170 [Planctomycetaceae bacterium]|nr:hypothetical protein [Planctomycetales bacterium]MCB9922538.1 hypothetical protein [Planctomycetaceae bacterium]